MLKDLWNTMNISHPFQTCRSTVQLEGKKRFRCSLSPLLSACMRYLVAASPTDTALRNE